MARALLVVLLLLAPAWAQASRDDAIRAAMRFREAFLKSQQPKELYPFMSQASIAAVEAKQKANPAEFQRIWGLAHMMSAMDVAAAPAGAKKIDKLTVQGRTATYVTGYELKTKDGTSKSSQITHLVLEDGVWKVDFQMEPGK